MTATATKEVPRQVKLALTKAQGRIDALQITSPEELKEADQLLKAVMQLKKGIQAEEDKIAKPAHAAWKAALDLFRPYKAQATQYEQAIKGKMVEYHNQIEAQRQKELAKFEKKVDAGRMKLQTGIAKAEALPTVDSNIGASQYRKVKQAEIYDVNQIPVRYFAHPKVQEALLAAVREDLMRGVEVPGARVVRKTIVAGGTK